MGRLWLALALVVAFVAPARAYKMRLFDSEPRVTNVYLEIGGQRTSTGLHDVERLRLAGDFRHAAHVRIAIQGPDGHESTIDTTPDHLDLAAPMLLSPLGTVRMYVSTVDDRGTESLRARLDVVAHRRVPDSPVGLLFGLAEIVGAIMGLVLIVALLFKMRANEVHHTRARNESEPTGLPAPAAENHIRVVAMRALFALVVVTAIVVVAIGTEAFGLFFGSPVLFIIAITAITRVINAGRAIALLHRPGAAAQTRHDQLEVAAADRHVTLRSSPALVERARRDALPRATL